MSFYHSLSINALLRKLQFEQLRQIATVQQQSCRYTNSSIKNCTKVSIRIMSCLESFANKKTQTGNGVLNAIWLNKIKKPAMK